MYPRTLTLYERQSLINQYRIIAKLYPEQAQECHRYVRILHEGYSIAYKEIFDVWREQSMEQGRYVYEVLEMYRHLRTAYDSLLDKQGLTENDIAFPGFNGNNEYHNLFFVEYLRDHGEWEETLRRDRSLDSQPMITMNLYPRMLEKYNAIRDKKDGDSRFSADEIKEVLSPLLTQR